MYIAKCQGHINEKLHVYINGLTALEENKVFWVLPAKDGGTNAPAKEYGRHGTPPTDKVHPMNLYYSIFSAVYFKS